MTGADFQASDCSTYNVCTTTITLAYPLAETFVEVLGCLVSVFFAVGAIAIFANCLCERALTRFNIAPLLIGLLSRH